MWNSISFSCRGGGRALSMGALFLTSVACASRTTEMETGAVVTTQPTSAVRSAQSVTANWPMKPREAASTLIAKYGQPDVVGDRVLIWHDKAPFKKIALMRDEQPHSFPMAHTDFLALNLAHDVATGARTVEDARAFYAKTAMEFKQGNRSSPYVTGLRFQPDRGAADPDKT